MFLKCREYTKIQWNPTFGRYSSSCQNGLVHSFCLALIKAKGETHGMFAWGRKTQAALEGFKANKGYRLGLEGPAKTVVEGVVHNRGCSGSWWTLYFYSGLFYFQILWGWEGGGRANGETDGQTETEKLRLPWVRHMLKVSYFLQFLWNVTHQCWRDGSVAQST